ncbi:MAG: class I SAM-dependent methyltransferase [Chitinophagaceae bacterium]|nr:class I SAM-dependent methyltransferase [Chitinophagaceae bacterium]
MDRYQETFETWNNIALLYQNKFMDLDLYHASYDFITESITKRNASVLEVGCGPGNITRYLLSKRPDLNIHGIDIAPNMIALAQKNNPTAHFTVMDCRRLDEIKQTFDALVGGFCLPYLSQTDCQKLIADASCLLHDEGLLYLSFVEGDPMQSHFQISSTGHRSYFYFHDLNSLKMQLVKHKFYDLRTSTVEYKKSAHELELHTILTARKGTMNNEQ